MDRFFASRYFYVAKVRRYSDNMGVEINNINSWRQKHRPTLTKPASGRCIPGSADIATYRNVCESFRSIRCYAAQLTLRPSLCPLWITTYHNQYLTPWLFGAEVKRTARAWAGCSMCVATIQYEYRFADSQPPVRSTALAVDASIVCILVYDTK
ncbi:hypothetical protein VTO73DRAFT_12979 [Trametes versicolor]